LLSFSSATSSSLLNQDLQIQHGNSDKCCPAPNDVSSHVYQQAVMDQIQVESESLVLHAATPVHVTLQKKMEERTDANRANLEQNSA
jgi:hypothetical protein